MENYRRFYRYFVFLIPLFLIGYAKFFSKASNEPKLNNEQWAVAYKTARDEYKFYTSLPQLEIEYSGFSAKTDWIITIRFKYYKESINLPQLIEARGFKYLRTQDHINFYCKNGVLLSFFDDSLKTEKKGYGVIGMDKSIECLSVKE